MAATISIVRDRFQHIRPLKYDRIEQQETAAPGSSKKAGRTNRKMTKRQYITATRIDRHIHT